MNLERETPHVFHGGDSSDNYWDAQGIGYLSEDEGAPGNPVFGRHSDLLSDTVAETRSRLIVADHAYY